MIILSKIRKIRFKNKEEAVSPVVGVMLMLVVTIIIAAVVSGFAGGLMGGQQKAPSASFEVHIVNDGTWGGSYIDIGVKGVSDAIPTKDLKITTSWTAVDGTTGGATITGPNLTGNNTQYGTPIGNKSYQSPLGFGPGVQNWIASGNYPPSQSFGNYSLLAGTHLHNSAAGYTTYYGGYGVTPATRYQYTSGTGTWAYNLGPGDGGVDAMEAILGPNWNALRPGDVVTLRIMHIPSGKLIYDGKVTVEG